MGSTQHIKTKYGGGYECKIKFSLPEIEGFAYIDKFFGKALVKQRFGSKYLKTEAQKQREKYG